MKNVVKQIRNLFKHETKEPTAKFKCTKAQKAYRYGEISLRPPYAAHPSTFGRRMRGEELLLTLVSTGAQSPSASGGSRWMLFS